MQFEGGGQGAPEGIAPHQGLSVRMHLEQNQSYLLYICTACLTAALMMICWMKATGLVSAHLGLSWPLASES